MHNMNNEVPVKKDSFTGVNRESLELESAKAAKTFRVKPWKEGVQWRELKSHLQLSSQDTDLLLS